jgi:hypothetical protein
MHADFLKAPALEPKTQEPERDLLSPPSHGRNKTPGTLETKHEQQLTPSSPFQAHSNELM